MGALAVPGATRARCGGGGGGPLIPASGGGPLSNQLAGFYRLSSPGTYATLRGWSWHILRPVRGVKVGGWWVGWGVRGSDIKHCDE